MTTFRLDAIAAKTATEMIQALQYNVCMTGIPIDGPSTVLCDNNAVVKNSTLKRKNVAICCHWIY